MPYISGEGEFVPPLDDELRDIPGTSSGIPSYPSLQHYLNNLCFSEEHLKDPFALQQDIQNSLQPIISQIEQYNFDLQERLVNLHKVMYRLIYGGVLTQELHAQFESKSQFWPFQKMNNGNQEFEFPGIYKLTTMLMALRYGYSGEWDDLDRQETGRSCEEIPMIGEFFSWFGDTDKHTAADGDGFNSWLPNEFTKRINKKVKAQYDDFFHKLLEGNPDLAADIEKILTTDEYKEAIVGKVMKSIRDEVKKEYADTIKKLTGESSVYETVVSGKHQKIEVTSEDRVKKFGEILDAMIVQEKKSKLVTKANGKRFQKVRDGQTSIKEKVG